MNTLVNLRRNLANSVAKLFITPSASTPVVAAGIVRRKVIVIGGGPVGLAFATSLHAEAGDSVDITVADARWIKNRRHVRWQSADEGVNRREQVVTIQSLVFSRLPAAVREAAFPIGGYGEVWPTGRESPVEHGFPRNVRIRDVEDRLLELAQVQGLHLIAERIDPEKLSLDDWDLVVIADGSGSRTRDHFADAFGRADATPYSIGNAHLTDTVLGVRIRTRMSDPSSVVMTVAQQRYLLNTMDGDGLLYMRLTDDEAKEVRGRVAGEPEFYPCIQSAPCQVTWHAQASRNAFVCSRRGSEFVPATDPQSFLWPRLLQGLKLFDIPKSSIAAITTFPLAMTRRGAFVAELTPTGTHRPVFGALIGDAAGVTHFWPGRGLNRGLSSAYALAITLSRLNPEQHLRSADFADFEGIMAQLQSRHQDRAWRAMVQMRDGCVLPVKTIIANALADRRTDRQALLREMQVRLAGLASGLKDRLPAAPDLAELFAALDRVDDETLAVLAQSRAWETRASGGGEIDVDAILRVGKAA